MHGIVSLLPQPYYSEVEKLWDRLENNFGLSGIRVTPFPHFSWQIGENYDEPLLRKRLKIYPHKQAHLRFRLPG